MRLLLALYRRSQELLEPAYDVLQIIRGGFDHHVWLTELALLFDQTLPCQEPAIHSRDQFMLCMQLQVRRLIDISDAIRTARRLIDTQTWPNLVDFRSLACRNPIHGCIVLPPFIMTLF